MLYGGTEAFNFPNACVSVVANAPPSCVDAANGTATISGSITATNKSVVNYLYQYGATANNCTGSRSDLVAMAVSFVKSRVFSPFRRVDHRHPEACRSKFFYA